MTAVQNPQQQNQQRGDDEKVIELKQRQRPTVEVKQQIRDRLHETWLVLEGDPAEMTKAELVKAQNLLMEVWEEVESLSAINRTLAKKFAAEAESRIMAEYNQAITEEYAQNIRENAIEQGVALFSQLLSRELDMYPKDTERVVKMIMGELPDGSVDEIPPALRAQIRETFEDIARMCLEGEIELADFDE